LSINAFQKEPLYQLLMKHYDKFEPISECNQLLFNDF
jgi:hypothetical protein